MRLLHRSAAGHTAISELSPAEPQLFSFLCLFFSSKSALETGPCHTTVSVSWLVLSSCFPPVLSGLGKGAQTDSTLALPIVNNSLSSSAVPSYPPGYPPVLLIAKEPHLILVTLQKPPDFQPWPRAEIPMGAL